MTRPPPKKERLVCHTCGHRYPIDTLVSINNADCCKKPKLHVHNLEKPCTWCVDKPNDSD